MRADSYHVAFQNKIAIQSAESFCCDEDFLKQVEYLEDEYLINFRDGVKNIFQLQLKENLFRSVLVMWLMLIVEPFKRENFDDRKFSAFSPL